MPEEIKKEERLLKVLSIVNEWLKFAEAKNAMLIAFNGASIYGIAKLFDDKAVKDSWILHGYLFIAVVILVFSTMICLLSFVPRIKFISSTIYSENSTTNSLFYEHLKTRSITEIIQDICETDEKTFSRFEQDIANQIKQNSEIASKKLSYFTVSIWLTVSAYVTPITAFLFWIFTYTHRKGS